MKLFIALTILMLVTGCASPSHIIHQLLSQTKNKESVAMQTCPQISLIPTQNLGVASE